MKKTEESNETIRKRLIPIPKYKGNERWDTHRWAWEFLTRNKEFREACDKVLPSDIKGQQAVAKKFGLSKFKHYNEPYKNDRSPRFASEEITSASNLEEPRVRVRPTLGLNFGQVVIRFDLNMLKIDEKTLERQIELAEHKLKVLKAKFISQENFTPPRHKPKMSFFLRYLKLLDLTLGDVSTTKCAEIMRSKKAEDRNSVEKAILVKASLRAARNFASKNYRMLAVQMQTRRQS